MIEDDGNDDDEDGENDDGLCWRDVIFADEMLSREEIEESEREWIYAFKRNMEKCTNRRG